MSVEPSTILLVEDNPDHAELVIRIMEDAPVRNRMVLVDDGQAALDYLFGRGDYGDRLRYPLPQLILLDLHLPKVDGLEVLRIVKEDCGLRTLPIVILSTSDSERDIEKAYLFHANSYLTKLSNIKDFSQLLSDAGLYWLALNRRPKCPDDPAARLTAPPMPAVALPSC